MPMSKEELKRLEEKAFEKFNNKQEQLSKDAKINKDTIEAFNEKTNEIEDKGKKGRGIP